jgi:DNA-binding transcriptional MerR regulator/methylmalonyl-CoA mutase cobalamin-binding subunit
VYTIKQAASRARVAVPTLRAWERRYGVVTPARTASGYRLYDEAAIARLAAMRRLVDAGWQPSQAATAILEGGPSVAPEDGSVALAPAGPSRPSGPSQIGASVGSRVSAPSVSDDLAQRLVAAAAALDEEAISSLLDDLFARGSFEHVATDFLFPALAALGEAWAAGEVSVAGEHLASNAVLRRLGAALEAAGRGDETGPRAVVGLPPGARHELGALAFAVALRRAGLPVAYLGPDLPADDWVRATTGAAAAIIAVPTGRDRRAAAQVVRRLREANPGLVIGLGGHAAADIPNAPEAIRLPQAIAESARTLVGLVRAVTRPTPA